MTSSPRTYSAAVDQAEAITVAELLDLIEQSKSVTVLRPRRPLVHAYVVGASEYGKATPRAFVSYEYCTRNGYGAEGFVTTFDAVVFDFYNLGRLVKVGA